MRVTKTKNLEPHKHFERLEARISADQKDLFKKAAALEGQTLTDFVVGCVVQEAKRVVHENEVIRLSERDRQIFVKAMLNPPAPNKALKSAAKKHAKITGGGD